MHRLLLVAAFHFLATVVLGQQVEVERDTVTQPTDTTQARKPTAAEIYARRFQPRKAILYSAVLPGMGQVYNKKYWKVPLIYGGFYIITSVAIAYNNLYETYKNELFGLLQVPSIPPPSGYSEEQLRNLTDSYRRQRDFFLVIDGFWYILQLVDAHVDAHLREFDLNPSLKVTLEPVMKNDYLTGRTSGFALTLRF